MTQKRFDKILDDAARDRIPDELNLLPRIAAQYEMQRGTRMKPQVKFTLAAVLALAVIAVLLVTVPSVAAAMQRVLGYVPGLGLVEQGTPLRVLAEPVTVEREGVRYTVEKASSDSLRTILLVSVTGIGSSEMMTSCVAGNPKLRLADGTIFSVQAGTGYGWDTGYQQRLVFDALPAKTENVVLEMPCLMLQITGTTPQNWEIPLVFEDAGDLEVAPVIELPPAPTIATSEQAEVQNKPPAESERPTLTAESPYGITLTVEKVVELDDSYILMGRIDWTDEMLGDYAVSAINPVITDADGNPVPFDYVAPDFVPPPGSRYSAWAYKIYGKEHRWPVTLKSEAQVTLGLPVQPSFTLDLDHPPAEGQHKDLNIELEADGYTINILSYTTSQDPEGNAMISFKVLADREVFGMMIFDTTNPILGGGGGGGGGSLPAEPEPFMTGFTYNGALPSGPAQFAITAIMLQIDGGWTVSWQP